MARPLGLLALLASLVMGLASISAQETPRKSGPEHDGCFRKLDQDHNGKLTRDEFLNLADRFKDRDRARQRLTVVYDSIDPQHVGITAETFRNFLEMHRKKTVVTTQQ